VVVDPVSLIVSALAAGAVAGAQNTATDAVKDAYTGPGTTVGTGRGLKRSNYDSRQDLEERHTMALSLDPQLRVADVVSIAALLAATASAIFAGTQVRRSRLTSRHQFLFDTFDRYFRDERVREFYYALDYHVWIFDSKSLPNSPEEPALDHLIYTFDMMEKMVRAKVFTESDVDIFGFQAVRVIDNPEVRKYLNWLDDEYSMVFGSKQIAHSNARAFAARYREKARR
jgi:hypothetical protein